jgi:hypothetical protein
MEAEPFRVLQTGIARLQIALVARDGFGDGDRAAGLDFAGRGSPGACGIGSAAGGDSALSMCNRAQTNLRGAREPCVGAERSPRLCGGTSPSPEQAIALEPDTPPARKSPEFQGLD